jgi:hypothetical protein
MQLTLVPSQPCLHKFKTQPSTETRGNRFCLHATLRKSLYRLIGFYTLLDDSDYASRPVMACSLWSFKRVSAVFRLFESPRAKQVNLHIHRVTKHTTNFLPPNAKEVKAHAI